METNVRTPQQVFYLPQHLVIPLFQRRYVWDETDQWLPLWQDVTRMAELRLREPQTTAQHFLGAIVLQAGGPVPGAVQAWNVVDGQQRLTTLQLLIDATAAILVEHGIDDLAQQLEDLTHNRSYAKSGPTLKLRHTNRDSDAFDEVMTAAAPVEHALLKYSDSLISRAHGFFSVQVADWLARAETDSLEQRAGALVEVLVQGLQLVVINLQAQEDSQEIFETLNARGTPLTSADLIKNFVFQRLETEGVDVRRAYAEDWPFETDFWEAELSVGRQSMSRGSVFLGQWLAARTGTEISPRQTFTLFKYYVDHDAKTSMNELLAAIKAQATQYERWTLAAADPTRELSVTELAFYRMQASGIELLKPAIIWLRDPSLDLPRHVAETVIRMLESWVVRRQLLRLNSGGLGRVVAELIHAYRNEPADGLADKIRTHLAGLNVITTYWPGDEEIRKHLQSEQAYRRYPRSRLRMYLEAVEESLRGVHHSASVRRAGTQIEHVMPQRWETNWPVNGLEAELSRAEHINRLGNLTLLTTSLNNTVSNGPWLGTKGKQAGMLEHDVFLMNRVFRGRNTWDETGIEMRTDEMIDALLTTWPVPEGHDPDLNNPVPTGETWVEIKHLVAGRLLAPGTNLRPPAGASDDVVAIVTEDGNLEIAGQRFSSPSGAARHVRQRHTNGWTYWRLEDDRKLADIRAKFRGGHA